MKANKIMRSVIYHSFGINFLCLLVMFKKYPKIPNFTTTMGSLNILLANKLKLYSSVNP